MESFAAHDGLTISCAIRDGAPRAVFAHATGFCKEVWRPVIRHLDGWGSLAVDQRGHGGSEVGAMPYDWWDLGRDLLAAVEAARWERPIGVGHSSGAASLVMAEVLRPGTFAALVLVEPIVFPPPYVRYEALPLAVAAERRRASFPSAGAARQHLHGRGPFAGWQDEAFDAYLEGGLAEREGEWVLRCRPEVEAECYRTATLHAAWDRMGEVACPALVVGGEASDSHPAAFLGEQAARLGDAGAEVVPGTSHFVPMEAPEIVAGLIRRAAAGAGA